MNKDIDSLKIPLYCLEPGKVYLYYTTVQTKLKVTKTIFVYKKGNKDVEIRDIELKPEEIDEKDVKLLMAYGDMVSINFFKNSIFFFHFY